VSCYSGCFKCETPTVVSEGNGLGRSGGQTSEFPSYVSRAAPNAAFPINIEAKKAKFALITLALASFLLEARSAFNLRSSYSIHD